ncbi:MAG: helix-turn-helix domain-containing protein [Leuconostoc gelidum]|jgi:HTH-type transcriptional regulator, SHP3-responsive repressor|uniref:helix-turn-helix domain-containing protein n=1 Tax=Leuconostoc gelidum TaxID=1244 RepID=UPI00157670D2|nr:Rgg/GadR/MutR family transcriptional regulator [Leuconostoc gelidum]MBZ6001299.1 helix-turn-helix domain-containing protein [Leuconostoc gelidum subsp. gelidum]QDJ29890.1 transcriptional regulator [Leuconostoc gelidum subsp. gelidum]
MIVQSNSIIRKTRKSRGISQKELGQLIGSQSMISRIENGLTSPTDYALQQICDILNVPIVDYFDTVFDKKNDLSLLKAELEQAFVNQNKMRLEKICESIKVMSANRPNDVALRHFFLMAKSTMYHLDFNIASASIQQEITDYFFGIENWQYYDLCLFFFVANMISVEHIQSYITDIIEQYVQKIMSPNTSRMVAPVLIVILEASIVQHQYHLTSDLLDKIAPLTFYQQNFEFQTWLLFWEGIFEDNVQKINDAYDITHRLHIVTTKSLFDRILTHYQIEK